MQRLLSRIAIIPIAILTSTLLLVTACDINLDPRDELPEEAVWADPGLVEAYMADIYRRIGWGFGDPMIAGTADEAVNTHGHGDAASRLSNFTPDDLGAWEWQGHQSYQKYRWDTVFGVIRDINILIEGVQDSEALAESTRETMLGEAYFLRGYFFHNLMRLYGGLPLIDEPFELTDELEPFYVPRGTFEETIEFIVADLDRAVERLSTTGRRLGAATQGAALALKARVLLHAASDLYAQNPSGNALVGYTDGDQQARWQRAKDAAQAVIDLGLYSLDPTPTADEYHQLIIDGGGSETIWARYFDADGGWQHNQSLWVSPNGWNSWSGDTPTQEHVDAYETADGEQFDWNNPDHAADPYANRDPRLTANVLYNGQHWRERPSGMASLDPVGVYQPGWYEMPGQDDLRPGLDTREGPNEQWNGTRTGYNLRKFVSRDVMPHNEQAHNPWIFIRYAEVLLNYAEASAELGQTEDAVWALNQVRERVDMPAVPADGGDGRTLMDRIRNERNVELAFEEHRFFDVRRWMIAPEVYSEPARGIRITGRLDPDGVEIQGHRYRFEYEIRNIVDRSWDDRAYFLPIWRDEMNANPALEQNPGYN